MESKNLSKLMPPAFSCVSKSAIIAYIVGFFFSKPSDCIAAFNSLGSMTPELSVSKRAKASLISSISSSVRPGLSKTFLLTGDF